MPLNKVLEWAMPNLTDFKIMRVRKGFTQVELSKAVGMPQASVSRWEHGRCKPTITVALRLATLLDVDVEELIKCFE